MVIKKSVCIFLLAILGLPQISLASVANIDNMATEGANSSFVELNEEDSLLAQRNRRQRARERLRSRPRPNRPINRERRWERRREFRRDVRDEVRRERNRRTAGRILTGVVGVGIGAAIAESNRNNRQNTETIIIDQGREIQDRAYYNDLYKCDYLEQGGYYNADELEQCLREN